MKITAPSSPQTWWLIVRQRVAPVIILIYLILALVAFALIPVLAIRWISLPFPGAFIEQTLLLSNSASTRPGDWPLQALKLEFGQQVVAIDGQAVTNYAEVVQIITHRQVGDTIDVQIVSLKGEAATIPVELIAFPVIDQIAYLIVPYLTGFVHLITGIWVFSLRRHDATGQAFVTFTTSVALGLAAFFDMETTHVLTPLWTMAIPLIGAALINFALLFPSESGSLRTGRYLSSRPYLRVAVYLPALVITLLGWLSLYNFERPDAYVTDAWRPAYIFTGIGVLFFILWTFRRLTTSPSSVVREQARRIMLGALFGFSPTAVYMIITVINPSIVFTPVLLLPVVIFPVATAYAILRYRLLNTDYLLTRFALYALLMVLAALGYGALTAGLTLILGSAVQASNPYLLGAFSLILALILYPLRNTLQKMIDAVFARGQAGYREHLQTFGRELTRAMELHAILSLLQRFVYQNLGPIQLHIFVHDPLSDHYLATPEPPGRGEPQQALNPTLSQAWERASRPSSDLRFATTSPLVKFLSSRRTSLFLGEATSLPVSLRSEHARLALLGSRLFVPLPGRQRLTGWLSMSERRSGEPYSQRDLEFLESLCDQAALAVERAQVVADLERRVHEMNVLSRVSQGINVTLAFDDMLELIYAQTTQVIPTQDFRLTLADSFSGILYHVFYLENDERLESRERRPIPTGQGLEQEIMKNRRPLVTEDYERECRGKGVLPSAQGLFSWLGVPLNAGAETIGVLSLGSRDPSASFTDDQVRLLQAIADQAAGAIVKARLLQEAERRTRQLTTLNEVARSLTSTLELSPLLNQILHSAVDILNCEAGSLLLVDEQTDELVFHVVIGPSTLIGQRLPKGTGLVGKAIDSRQAIIANDVRRSKDWFEKPDEQTGFTTKDLLVVPMEAAVRSEPAVRGEPSSEVIGVIEVINRKDGLPFTPDDQGLLAAFASQAAVAIDNARLYTQTDQNLAARVEELSVMQRIDRELNASLDVDRAMRITLEWGMRQSEADAGLVGVLEEPGIRIVASQGYANELAPYKETHLPLTLRGLNESVEQGQPRCLYASEDGHDFSLLKRAQRQLVVPIRREDKAIGVIMMESALPDVCPDETMAFISRLSDHAAIAIANAQLYAEVQAANLAKSEFVSLVSHELKTPMTSIRGFTDLMASGVVGAVNEAQANFLGTIRSNVDRMATLVSDLADASRIEAGRLRLDFTAIQVVEVVNEVVRSTRAQILEKEQNLELQLPDSLPPMWGDQTRVIQVLTNLVSNAYKYTPNGGLIVISGEVADNQWDAQGARRVIRLSVKDNGHGIAPEDQKKIFQKFFRSDDQKVRDAPGTGLGLNITKTLVEMQGGRIWFESEFRQGTTFHFTVPVVETA